MAYKLIVDIGDKPNFVGTFDTRAQAVDACLNCYVDWLHSMAALAKKNISAGVNTPEQMMDAWNEMIDSYVATYVHDGWVPDDGDVDKISSDAFHFLDGATLDFIGWDVFHDSDKFRDVVCNNVPVEVVA